MYDPIVQIDDVIRYLDPAFASDREQKQDRVFLGNFRARDFRHIPGVESSNVLGYLYETNVRVFFDERNAGDMHVGLWIWVHEPNWRKRHSLTGPDESFIPIGHTNLTDDKFVEEDPDRIFSLECRRPAGKVARISARIPLPSSLDRPSPANLPQIG